MAKRKSKRGEHAAAVEAVAEAAQRVENARLKLDEGWKRLSKEKSDADQALREALANLQRIREEHGSQS
jgi:predicted nucleic acid-binding protein